jgi:imidazolonepropionase-like amidohydrolase
MRSSYSVLIILAAMVLAPRAMTADMALVHGRIYPSPEAKPIADGTLIIHDGRIQRLGPASAVKVSSDAKVPTADRGLTNSPRASSRTIWR